MSVVHINNDLKQSLEIEIVGERERERERDGNVEKEYIML